MGRILLTLLLILLALPEAADACAVCFSGKDESRTAYIATTALLTFLPLGLVGGFVAWVWRRSRAIERAHAEAAPQR